MRTYFIYMYLYMYIYTCIYVYIYRCTLWQDFQESNLRDHSSNHHNQFIGCGATGHNFGLYAVFLLVWAPVRPWWQKRLYETFFLVFSMVLWRANAFHYCPISRHAFRNVPVIRWLKLASVTMVLGWNGWIAQKGEGRGEEDGRIYIDC